MGGLLSSHEAELYIEHGSETPQDIVTGVTDMAKISVGASLRTSKADAATMFWKIVVNPGSTLEPPVDLSGVCTELHNDEVWILAPLAYSADAGLLETERDVDASGTPTTLRKLKGVKALRDGVLRMGEPFVLWRARTSAGSDGVWRVRYAGPQQVDLRSRQRAGSAAAASNTLSMDADAIEARQFALEMHEASVPENELLAHARAVLRRYHVFYQVTEHDVKLASSSA